MTIVTIDTETQGLNTHNWIMGTVCDEDLLTISFRKREELWEHLMRMAEQHRKRKKTLLVYAHNMHYDFLVVAPEELPVGARIYSYDPYIVDFRDEKNRIYCKFVTTTSLWRGSLASMGDALGNPKGKTPEWLTKPWYEPTAEELDEAQRYMEQDARVLMHYLLRLKKLLRRYGVRTRWMLTAGQIGVNKLLQVLLDAPNSEAFFNPHKRYQRQLLMTKYPEQIHSAVRGGRVQALAYGGYYGVSAVDINSHYPHCITTMRWPDLRTENMLHKPLERGWDLGYLLSRIGISECAVSLPKTPTRYGVLPVRTESTETAWPKTKGQLLIGCWTHRELQAAVERGYTIEHIRWSLIWQETANPVVEYFTGLSQARLHTEDEMEHHFLKILMNASIGKLAQRRELEDLKWAHLDATEELLEEGWSPVEQSGYYRLFSKPRGKHYPCFYAPILYALITAEARIRLLEHMEKIPSRDLYYVDTDSLIGGGEAIKRARFKYGKNLGEMKLEAKDQELLVYGKKSYMIGESVKLSGIGKHWISTEDFRAGTIRYKRMITERMTHDKRLVGTFADETRHLGATMTAAIEQDEAAAKQPVLVDIATSSSGFVEWMAHKVSMQEGSSPSASSSSTSPTTGSETTSTRPATR